jgi:predicted transcriptional regulator
VTFFRSLGSSIGTAVFGVILTNRLAYHLHHLAPHAAVHAGGSFQSATAIKALAPAAKAPILQAFTMSFHDVFLAAVPFAVIAFIVALALKETPLRTSTKQEVEADVVGM